MPFTKPTKEQLMKNLSEKLATFSQDFKNFHQEAKKQGFVNIMKLLWWDQSIQIQGMYWVYTLNSLVGWYQWTKALKKEVA